MLKTETGGRLLFSQQEKTLMPLERLLSLIDYSLFSVEYGMVYCQEINYLTEFYTAQNLMESVDR